MILLRHAFRSLWRAPAFTALAIVVMAVAIGACSALFSAFFAVVARPLGYPDPDSLVSVWLINREKKVEVAALSWAKYEAFRSRQDVFREFAMSGNANFTLVEGGADPEQVAGLYVTANFLPTLGLALEHGRGFLAEEDREGGENVAIISHALWQGRFGGTPDIIGRTIRFDGTPRRVVGVLPAKMPAPYRHVSVLVPRPLELPYLSPQQRMTAIVHQAVARLAPGVTLEQAQARLTEMNAQFRAANPTNFDAQNESQLRTITQQVVGNVGRTFWILAGAVGAVFLIACANVANLFLARIQARLREIAVRLSLGASRGMIVRQFIAESVIFSVIAGVLGLFLAAWLVQGIQALAGPQLPRGDEITLNDAALVVALGGALLASLSIGLYPALHASRADLNLALKDAGRGVGATPAARKFRHALVVAQLALSLVLLICSGLLVRTFARLQQADLGYAVEGRALGTVTLPATRYPDADAQREFYTRLQEKLRTAPELARGAAVTTAPLYGNPFFTAFAVVGRPLPAVNERPVSTIRSVTPDYFATLDMTLATGRAFSDADRSGAQPVAIINETLAAKLFPGETALDRSLVLGAAADSVPVRIVGVLKNVRSAGANAPAADEIYVPRSQRGGATMHVIAQANAGLTAEAVLPVLRRLLREMDPDLALANPQTLEKLTAQSLGVTRLMMTLLLGFAVISLLLATVGVYSVMAYSITLRTAEIGLRVALGASPRDVLRTVVRAGVLQTAAGVGLGLIGAAASTRLLQQALYEVKPMDPVVFGLATSLFVIASAVAILVPTRRAMRVDPMVALRAE